MARVILPLGFKDCPHCCGSGFIRHEGRAQIDLCPICCPDKDYVMVRSGPNWALIVGLPLILILLHTCAGG